MAIEKESVKSISVGKIEWAALRIPAYQRPYSWTVQSALKLFDDIQGAFQSGSKSYILGSIILHKSENLDVVDGQQRLITLRVLLYLLKKPECYTTSDAAPIKTSPLGKVIEALREQVLLLKDEKDAFKDYLLKNCWLVQIETGDADEAFRIFDSQNYRGKSLLPHDLLKAYHLRVMSAENESPDDQVSIVNTWEAAGDTELDRLFSVYLWRIRCWSRGVAGPEFTVREIDAFKGISKKNLELPHAQYHYAAQNTARLLTVKEKTEKLDEDHQKRLSMHARFQLESPIIAGRDFFEMVSFFLKEWATIYSEAFEEEVWKEFSSLTNDNEKKSLEEVARKSRYRYITHLYIAALLYYRNKFGDDRFNDFRKFLRK